MRMTLTTFTQLFRDYQESGLNVRDFCSNQGIAPSSFYYWRKKLVGSDNEDQPKRFVPLVLDSGSTDDRVYNNRVNIRRLDKGLFTTPIEFVFPNGTKMILRDAIDMSMLKTIVHLID